MLPALNLLGIADATQHPPLTCVLQWGTLGPSGVRGSKMGAEHMVARSTEFWQG
jgi:hypothetical protein